jgi:hypothetical protein
MCFFDYIRLSYRTLVAIITFFTEIKDKKTTYQKAPNFIKN